VVSGRGALFFLLWAVLVSGCTGCPPPAAVPEGAQGGECVVLLHGLARTCRAMGPMEETLQRAGYRTINLDYSSREKTIEEIAAQDFTRGVRFCEQAGAEKIHFVTHSMGGIVVRLGLKTEKPARLGRVVMLAPPNQGSFVTDRLRDWWFYRWLNGPAGQELGTGPDSLPNRLGPVDYPVGIIAADDYSWFDAWFAGFTTEPNDGKVTVASTRLEGMADFLVMPENHSFIMTSEPVMEQTVYFLRHGRFRRP
jgi:pimeloyl-ACP methyl ester carboxylesterase